MDSPPPINRTYEDAGTVGVFMFDPGQTLGAKTAFAKQSYDNWFNGTWVLGYEVTPEAGHSTLTVETSAEPVDPLGEIHRSVRVAIPSNGRRGPREPPPRPVSRATG